MYGLGVVGNLTLHQHVHSHTCTAHVDMLTLISTSLPVQAFICSVDF
jgi:hypothetical protein